MEFIQLYGSAVGTFCVSGPKRALFAMASVGSLLLLPAQVEQQRNQHSWLFFFFFFNQRTNFRNVSHGFASVCI